MTRKTYNDGNQLTQRSIGANNYSYTYDKKGNLTKEGNVIREFKWNDDNRLIDVDNVAGGDTSAEYTYDSLGRRILSDDGSVKTMYYYDGLTVIAEKEKIGAGSWNWDRIFTVAPGVIGNIFRISTKSGEYWVDKYYHYDAIGNVVMTTNSQEEIDSAFEQEAYGNVKSGSPSGYHLTTKEYDSIGELYYFWQRWYDPVLGRFVSKDILNNINRYKYSNNNPVIYIDPNGLYPVVPQSVPAPPLPSPIPPNPSPLPRPIPTPSPLPTPTPHPGWTPPEVVSGLSPRNHPLPDTWNRNCGKACDNTRDLFESLYPLWDCYCQEMNPLPFFEPPGFGTHYILFCYGPNREEVVRNPSIGPWPVWIFPR